jgi:hypothetical protein
MSSVFIQATANPFLILFRHQRLKILFWYSLRYILLHTYISCFVINNQFRKFRNTDPWIRIRKKYFGSETLIYSTVYFAYIYCTCIESLCGIHCTLCTVYIRLIVRYLGKVLRYSRGLETIFRKIAEAGGCTLYTVSTVPTLETYITKNISSNYSYQAAFLWISFLFSFCKC